MSKIKTPEPMVTVNTLDLRGPALDWVIAATQNHKRVRTTRRQFGLNVPVSLVPKYSSEGYYADPIIDREGISTVFAGGGWDAWINHSPYVAIHEDLEPGARGQTPLVAAMRCYVASKLGFEVEIPGALVQPDCETDHCMSL